MRNFHLLKGLTFEVKSGTALSEALEEAQQVVQLLARQGIAENWAKIEFQFDSICLLIGADTNLEDAIALYNRELRRKLAVQEAKKENPVCTEDSDCPIHLYHNIGDLYYVDGVPFYGE